MLVAVNNTISKNEGKAQPNNNKPSRARAPPPKNTGTI